MPTQSFPNPFKTELPADEPLIIMSRTFNAPLALVWKVWTEKQHVAYWFGPCEDNEVVEYDVRTGGKWRVISTMEDGSQIVFFGTYLAVEPRTLIRNTFVVEGQFDEDPRFYEEHRFEERDGKTFYRSVSKVDSIESRDAIVATGMEWGANASMVKVDEILERLKADG
jgi:uncharacterized protein YndB with AHSA1/START domain